MKDNYSLFTFFNEIGIISQLSQSAFERVLPDGMTLAQFRILNHFVRLGKSESPLELARAFQVSKATISSTIARLESKKLIEIHSNALDGRGKIIKISEEGKKMREKCIIATMPLLSKAQKEFENIDWEGASTLLSQIRKKLDDNRL